MTRLLVVTSVHPADDPRIRYKYIRTLATDFEVTYATRGPEPVDTADLTWKRLSGGRLSRWFGAVWLMVTTPADVIAIHDPELIPGGVLASLVRRRSVVFDLHENLPAQVLTKEQIPRWLRGPIARVAAFWLQIADRTIEVTLAENGYSDLFTDQRPVFANYPEIASLTPSSDGQREGVVYVGDVSEQRGAMTLVEAAGTAEVGPVTFVGRCSSDLEKKILERAGELGVSVSVLGWLPHPEAMQVVGNAMVGVSPLHDIPNYRDSLPTKTLEYLAMGTPVVASNLPGTANVIGPLAAVRLVEPGSVDALAQAIASVDMATVRDAEAGADDVRRRFQWPADDVRAFYASLAR